MGCDIHIAIQRQEPTGEWVDVPYVNPLYSFQEEMGEKLPEGFPVAPIRLDSRNYGLFAILAGVRNGPGWTPIAPHRGFPDGIDHDNLPPDPAYPDYSSRYMGDHSFTWVGLDELRNFDLDLERVIQGGIVDERVFLKLDKGEQPSSWCGGVGGPGVCVYNSPAEYWAAKAAGTLAPKPYVRVTWVETPRIAAGSWFTAVIPWLETLSEGRPLRLLLGFDS